MKPWKKVSSKTQKIGYKTVTIKEFVAPDGTIQEYTTWNAAVGSSIATIALTKDHKVIIARQFRQGPELVFDELPGGIGEEGEDPEKAARRELREETGYETMSPLKFMGPAYRDAYTNYKNLYYLALDCEIVSTQELDENEHVEVVLITIEQLIENAKNAKMSDGVAVLLAYNDLQEILNA